MEYYRTRLSVNEQLKFKHHYDLLNGVISEYLSVHAAGGSLHIVLEDNNWDIGSIEFCLKTATENNDWIGIAISKMLLDMPNQFIEDCDNLGFILASNKWSQKAIY